MAQTFQLTSPAFANGGMIPAKYTCKGENVSPPLRFMGVPKGTKSLALIMHDPDAPRGDWVHWLVWNISPDAPGFLDAQTVSGALQGTNDFRGTDYGGPCPPSGTHRYVHELYALDTMLDLAEGAPEEDLRGAIDRHAIAKTTLVGRFSTNPPE